MCSCISSRQNYRSKIIAIAPVSVTHMIAVHRV
jgi:hypothetical protein